MNYTPEMFKDISKDDEECRKAAAILNDELDPEDFPEEFASVARWIRQCYHRPSDTELKMAALNELFGFYGVEAIRVEGERVSHYDGEHIATYLNTGDTYVTTVLHDQDKDEFLVTSYGDFLEQWEAEHARACVSCDAPLDPDKDYGDETGEWEAECRTCRLGSEEEEETDE